jgi:hypothetical protein
MTVEQFAGAKPEMRLEEYFNGHATAYGLFFDRFADLRRQFRVEMNGVWDGTALTLNEDFTYDDGETQKRVWTFRKTGDGWVGTAPDVVGPAYGKMVGNAFHMTYTADVKRGTDTVRLDFDDWLFRQSASVVLNNARARKFGIDVGEVQLVFVK